MGTRINTNSPCSCLFFNNEQIEVMTNFYTLTDADFDSFFTLMEEAFPATERRSREEAYRVFTTHPCYNAIGYKDEQGVLALLAYWHFEDCFFIDHLAVDKRLQGKGMGTELMQYFLKNIYSSSVVVLEVEPPVDEITKKRVVFYERLGFKLNDFPYLQPSMQEGQPQIEMQIMSYPVSLTHEEFNAIRRNIFGHCYKVVE